MRVPRLSFYPVPSSHRRHGLLSQAGVLMTLAQTVGRSWAYGVLAILLCAAGSFHFVWLSRHGINGWTGEPKDRYLDLVGQTRAR